MIEMKDIEYVKAIHEHSTLTKAAESLFITQPSLSTYIKNMEERLGYHLFQRVGKRLVLNYAGEEFVKYGNDILTMRDELEMTMQTIKDKNYGRIRIGIPLIRGSYLMPPVLPEYEKLYPRVEVQLVEETATILEDRIMNGDCDIIIINASNENANLTYDKIGTEEILVAVPHDHPAVATAVENPDSKYPKIDLEELKDDRFIISTNDTKISREMDKLFSQEHFHPARTIKTNNIQTAVNLTIRGYGVSLVYENHYRNLNLKHDNAPKLFSFSSPSSKSDVIIAYRKGMPLPKYMEDFIELAKKFFSTALQFN
ncbi:LysR family transcriptional regulator [Aerococcus sanguinicola]|uniref:LysR family transcriptional regulator n=1 Tax=Aerococcus sanguinicola TaxID=119206 RepID=UPI0018A7017C|nr:LysR family transcriptional regulator [Aerococcus sanguinicola]